MEVNPRTFHDQHTSLEEIPGSSDVRDRLILSYVYLLSPLPQRE